MTSNKWILFGSFLFGFLGVVSTWIYWVSEDIMRETGSDVVYDYMSFVYKPVIIPVLNTWQDLWPVEITGGFFGLWRFGLIIMVPWFVSALIVSFSLRFFGRMLRSRFQKTNGKSPPNRLTKAVVSTRPAKGSRSMSIGEKLIYSVGLLTGMCVASLGLYEEMVYGPLSLQTAVQNSDLLSLLSQIPFALWINWMLDVIISAAFTLIVAFSIRFVWRKFRKPVRR